MILATGKTVEAGAHPRQRRWAISPWAADGTALAARSLEVPELDLVVARGDQIVEERAAHGDDRLAGSPYSRSAGTDDEAPNPIPSGRIWEMPGRPWIAASAGCRRITTGFAQPFVTSGRSGSDQTSGA
jgi:hypothetical protein